MDLCVNSNAVLVPVSTNIQLNTSSTELSTSKKKKKYSIKKDKRYTYITIDTVSNQDEIEVHINTAITKDRWLKSTRTTTKKIFIDKREGHGNLILREIDTERLSGKKKSSFKRAFVKLNKSCSLPDMLKQLPSLQSEKMLLPAS